MFPDEHPWTILERGLAQFEGFATGMSLGPDYEFVEAIRRAAARVEYTPAIEWHLEGPIARAKFRLARPRRLFRECASELSRLATELQILVQGGDTLAGAWVTFERKRVYPFAVEARSPSESSSSEDGLERERGPRSTESDDSTER